MFPTAFDMAHNPMMACPYLAKAGHSATEQVVLKVMGFVYDVQVGS